jgi:hypothetical protein
MKQLFDDTPLAVQQKQFEMARSLSPERRLELAFELTNTVREMILADIRFRFPEESEEQRRRRFIARVLSREEVIRAYGFDPRDLRS